MSSCVVDAELEVFSACWRPRWRGSRRLVMLTSSVLNPRLFVAYGTDGMTAFRVEGAWRSDLVPFLALMDAEGAELMAPPRPGMSTPRVRRGTYPGARTVQRSFDEALFG